MCNEAVAQYQKKRTRAHQDVVSGRMTYSVDTHIQKKTTKWLFFGSVTLLIWFSTHEKENTSLNGFPSGHVWMRELDYKESWTLKNWCFWTVVLEKTLERPLDCKEIQLVHPKGDQSWMLIWKDWCWSWNSNTLATWCKELTLLKRPWCWKRLKAGGEGDERGWDGWMESPTQWTWVWVNSRSWWWTRRPGVLHFMESQRVGHNWATELKWVALLLLGG